MKTWRDGSNRWTAKVAALLFALQVLLVGFAANAAADIMPRDQFGNVICSPASMQDARDGRDGSDHPAAGFDCCRMGCPTFGGPLAPPPALAPLLVRRPLLRLAPFVLHEDVGASFVETPRQTRGPPLSI